MDGFVNVPLVNRSKPPGAVIPVLGCEDVDEAVDWLCEVFGFTVRLRIGSHRVQLLVNNGLGGEGSVVATERGGRAPAEGSPFGDGAGSGCTVPLRTCTGLWCPDCESAN